VPDRFREGRNSRREGEEGVGPGGTYPRKRNSKERRARVGRGTSGECGVGAEAESGRDEVVGGGQWG